MRGVARCCLRLGQFLGARCVLPIVLFLSTALVPLYANSADKALKLLLWQAPSTLNPHLAPGIKDQTASRIVYEPLASFDREGRLVPFLAAEIPTLENGAVSADGRSVVWKLRHGVKWSDGHPFTAKDVLFTYNYITNPDVGSASIGPYKTINKVVVVDDYTVQITFKDVNPAWALPFVGVQGMILPEHVFAPYNNSDAATAPVNLAPVGTGPYRLKEFQTEDVLVIGEDVVNTVKVIFERNPYFRDAGQLSFDEVTLQGGGDASVAANAVLKEGVVDYAWNLQVDDSVLKTLETDGVGKATVSWGSYVERIMLNFTDPSRETAEGERSSVQNPHPALLDRNVRTALALAIDRQKIAALYGRTGRATSNILVAPAIFNSPNSEWAFDPDRAKAILDEAGWKDTNRDGVRDKNGVPLSFLFQTTVNSVRQQTQEIVKANLQAIGVKLENKMIDSSIFLGSGSDSTNSRRHFYADMEEYAYGNKSPDPGSYMIGWTCSEAAQKSNNWSGSNWARYCNKDYDALYLASTIEVDPAKRRQIFVKMNDLLVLDSAAIPLVHWADVSGISNALEGFDPTPWDSETWNIADWHRK
ncbi:MULTISPECIES: peptide ABC transporter substrate-binding protein [unclassified Rhizobium]|uniref:peptide ABC transporter substrate-binding protein n=1 Tax=unclassified Rhizobium TaxID=2613769 RepID=UPI00160BD2A5|nr:MULTISPECIES: peptide ABC transporter substrate-binding protein [unclassified Rhizobium]MBB3320218.1 peptide/nickel transport system substrate-binding protein [Rhizobium sp. BK181]MBB3544726.1 peptide/nickel transport system substrate-binding protein [Rhizobium sp. BK399]